MPARAGTDGGAVFLLSDYGTADEFAGLLRAVVARLAPGAPVVDLTHDVPAFDVRAGALALARAVPHLGPGVVLAVVDPGVGTARRGIACTVRRRDDSDSAGPSGFVGPDNGLLVWAAEAMGEIDEVAALAKPTGASSTFDGRDVFAPAAAALWRGERPASLGRPLAPDALVRLPAPLLVCAPGRIEAEVLWVDRFGNAQLAATADDGRSSGLLDASAVELDVRGATRLRVVSAFGELAPGESGILVDANGHLAIVCNERAAATVLGVQAGETVTLRLPGGGVP